MEKSIIEFLKKNIDSDIYPFHMPGHKRNKGFFRDIDFLNMDITEIDGADNLKEPRGIILQAEEKIAKAYGANRSFMLVHGSSTGLLAAVLFSIKDGEEILVARNSHESVYNGLVLSGGRPHYLYPEITDMGIVGGVSPLSVKEMLEKHPNIKAVLITSPTYEGFCSDIGKISEITKSFGKILIVDEAHGAHFGFHDKFPLSAVKLGADIVIQSFHKTMPTINQSAVMHVSEKIDACLMKKFINIVQTTSPSYIMMALIERCVDILKDDTDIFENYFQMLSGFRKSVLGCKNINIINEEIQGKFSIHQLDIGKCVFVVHNTNVKTADIYEKILKEYKIQLEMYGLNHFIAMTSICDSAEGFRRLEEAIYALDRELSLEKKGHQLSFSQMKSFYDNKADIALLPRKAANSLGKLVKIKKAENKISASFITPYPPGTPLVAPGEVISRDILDKILFCIVSDIKVIGVEKDCCLIVDI